MFHRRVNMAVVPYTVGIPIDAVGSNIPRALIGDLWQMVIPANHL